jgi:hypothetical protein
MLAVVVEVPITVIHTMVSQVERVEAVLERKEQRPEVLVW